MERRHATCWQRTEARCSQPVLMWNVKPFRRGTWSNASHTHTRAPVQAHHAHTRAGHRTQTCAAHRTPTHSGYWRISRIPGISPTGTEGPAPGAVDTRTGLPAEIIRSWRTGLLLPSCSVVSDSLQSHRLQHARLPCHALSPGVCSDSGPLSW